MNRKSRPDKIRECIAAATRCQSQISSIAEKGSLPERYCLLLEELRVEAVRQTEKMPTTISNADTMRSSTQTDYMHIAPHPVDSGQAETVNYMNSLDGTSTDFSGSIQQFAEPDFTDWGQFATMVSSGLGNLDAFLNDDPFML